ncbi:hypothetical protein BDF22DRAFT_658015 [Syncephalis plumigaleata]|nr:hypothetical protein BDF22DRAFT_658015 [Syncephalis plumigaleata]
MTETRPLIVDADTPTAPFPVFLASKVIHGFGRGSKELGIPTANMEEEAQESLCKDAKLGVYYGWAQVIGVEDSRVFPMVMSLGWNPYYKNEKRSAEVHLIHQFPNDFYGRELRVALLGYIRPEKNYDSLDALIADIHMDIKVAQHSLERPQYKIVTQHNFFAAS